MAKGERLTRVRPRQTNNSQLICAMRWQHAQHIRASPHSASTKTHRRQPPDGCSRSFAGPAIEDPMTLHVAAAIEPPWHRHSISWRWTSKHWQYTVAYGQIAPYLQRGSVGKSLVSSRHDVRFEFRSAAFIASRRSMDAKTRTIGVYGGTTLPSSDGCAAFASLATCAAQQHHHMCLSPDLISNCPSSASSSTGRLSYHKFAYLDLYTSSPHTTESHS